MKRPALVAVFALLASGCNWGVTLADGGVYTCDATTDCAPLYTCGHGVCVRCFPGKPEICNDGIDNNCDGLIDCQDPTCLQQPCGGFGQGFFGVCCATTFPQGCVDPYSDPNNCGVCGEACGSGNCNQGFCTCTGGGCPGGAGGAQSCGLADAAGGFCYCSQDNQCVSGRCHQDHSCGYDFGGG